MVAKFPELDKIERLDNRNGDWEPKAYEWRATHSQIKRAMKWKEKMENNTTIAAEFKMRMAMILRENERIEDLRFKPTTMIKNFEPKAIQKDYESNFQI